MILTQTIPWGVFSDKHKRYILNAIKNQASCAEGSIRTGKTVDNCIAAAAYLETCPDRFHLASGSSLANAKMNIGICNGFGLENLFRGRCRWGKFKDNECLYIKTKTGEKVVLFMGGGKSDSYKKILGYSIGLWIATEINEHYDSSDSRTSFIKVAMARQLASQSRKILWDLNPSNPDDAIYTEYIDKWKANYLGGYNYEHFTIYDNLNLTQERIKQIENEYTVGSIWYRRDILGERCIAQGLVFEHFANHVQDFIVDKEYLKEHKILLITVGVDFGGNQSATTFVANGITFGFKDLITLKAKRIKRNINAKELEVEFNKFCSELKEEYGKSFIAKCDSAESILINGLRISAAKVGVEIRNAMKKSINDRIRFQEKIMALKKYKILKDDGFNGTNEVINALCKATWNPKNPNERLDEVSYENPIDICDAHEYSFEDYMQNLLA